MAITIEVTAMTATLSNDADALDVLDFGASVGVIVVVGVLATGLEGIVLSQAVNGVSLTRHSLYHN